MGSIHNKICFFCYQTSYIYILNKTQTQPRWQTGSKPAASCAAPTILNFSFSHMLRTVCLTAKFFGLFDKKIVALNNFFNLFFYKKIGWMAQLNMLKESFSSLYVHLVGFFHELFYQIMCRACFLYLVLFFFYNIQIAYYEFSLLIVVVFVTL